MLGIFSGGSEGKESTSIAGHLGEDPLEKRMAPHSSILAWRIPWTESLAGHSPWGRKESDITEDISQFSHSVMSKSL